MKLVAAFTTPKRLGDQAPNEDAYDLSADHHTVAVSDGASESFDPALWARTLVQYFVEHPRFHKHWLRSAVNRYIAAVDCTSLPWYAEAAYERGSFATLLGVCIKCDSSRAIVLAIGDSLAVLANGANLLCTHPYKTSEEFRSNPLLLSTKMDRNEAFTQQVKRRSLFTVWPLNTLAAPRLMLMTDAMGAWLLEDPLQRVSQLLSISSDAQFADFVERERAAGRMRRDDSTLLILAGGHTT